ncbi:hypothetical protein JCM5353_008883 [Sporobolomyces roseus]
MSIPRPHSRGAPSSSSRPHSTHSSHSQSDAYIPPTTSQGESDFDFCNSFWVTPSTRNGSEERDWGREGYECLMTRVKSGGKVLEDLRTVLKERASIEEDYAKRLAKLSKSSFGTGETGHMERAMLTLKGELEQTSKSHHDLASLLRMQDSLVSDFTQKREGARKTQQSGIEKTWKSMNNQREHVLKAKTKYENDAIQINSLHAQASLLQGRDLDKATLKMDKVQQTVVVNERDYKNFVNVLKETTVNWNMAWKTFCDLVQDQEEERLEFVKGRMWDWANAQSTIAMAEDESAERTRTALEQCEPKLDIRIFVQRFATGNCIPDPLPFIDAARTTPHPKQSYKTAKFSRSSTRIPGVKHSPSAVNDIARALHQQTSSTPLSVAPQTNSARPPPSSSTSTSAIPQQQHSRGASSTSLGANGIPRPASRGANLYAESTSQTFSPSQETTPTRPVPNDSAPSSTSRFAVSPSAASLRQPPPSSDPRAVSPTPARPGHINAAAFQNRPSAIAPTQPPQSVPPPARYQASPASSPKKPSSFPSPYQNQSGGGGGDDENDPLLQALKVLQSTPAPAASPRSSRMSPHPQSTSSQSSSTPAPAPGRPLSSMGQRPNHRSQSSLGQNLPPAVGMGGGGGGRSRPTSPAPQAAMMQPPSSSSVIGSNQTQASYGQAFPGERAQQQQQQIARPHSRAGSNVSQQQQPNRNSLASPASVGNFQARPSSPGGGGGGGGFAGVGSATARGRSPSPQPFIPESLRPRSPAIQQQIHAQQQQQRPTSAYGNHAQAPPPPSNQYSNQNQNHYGGAPQGYPTSQSHPYAQPPPAQSNPYARATSPAPQQQQVGRPNSMVNYAPPPPQSQQQHPYSSQSQQFSNSPSSHLSQQQQQPSPYSGTTPSPQPTQSYPYPSQTPSHSHSHSQGQHSPYAPPPPQQQYAPPPPPSSVISQTSIQRTPSLHSGVSSIPPPTSHQQSYTQQTQQQVRAPSVASVRAGSTAPPPPTGQYTDQGVPIIFYVNALFDYRATSNEEFSFSQGDVIAVTATDPDGWWQGQRVGDSGNSKLFPSK